MKTYAILSGFNSDYVTPDERVPIGTEYVIFKDENIFLKEYPLTDDHFWRQTGFLRGLPVEEINNTVVSSWFAICGYSTDKTWNTDKLIAHLIQDLNSTVFCLWMVKDCAVNVKDQYFYFPWKTMFPVIAHEFAFALSNAKGEYEAVYFTRQEINLAIHYAHLVKWAYDNETASSPFNPLKNTYTPDNSDIYGSLNKIYRILGIIAESRKTSNLLLKISYYYFALETLFKKIKKGRDSSKQAELVKLIIECYQECYAETLPANFTNIMSTAAQMRGYITHGNIYTDTSLKKTDLVDISIHLDMLLRKLFTSALDTHKDYFINH